ncbi:uncharacterized protein CCOS01_03604 [Colletotrichum costaricense]|uniref:Uncharacterized protein n=1 Tax=Colletotrichum costaricense TaxID=1209916 RepID=A0AAI9Z6Q8_9PEZI|nr:uncharacterized protein CCOS01_03604 [Colletotrichum costaricense]KAK1534852.1 hypothetical protein CCOS01_03604 [Colletotrichum costaricense]
MSLSEDSTSSLSEESATAIRLYIKQLEDDLHQQITTEVKRVLESYEIFRSHCQQSLLAGLPPKYRPEERPEVVARIKAQFPCHINNFFYDNIAGMSCSAFQYAGTKPTPFTMPRDLISMRRPPHSNRTVIRRKTVEGPRFVTVNAVERAYLDSFVFSYTLDGSKAHWILLCPKQDCQSRNFSRDPIASGDAIAHFKQCEISAVEETTIIRRHGMQVVPHRLKARDQPISARWVAKHNKNIKAGNHRLTKCSRKADNGASPDSMEDLDTDSD